MTGRGTWTEEQDAILRKMAARGATAREIAAAIGGVSRCAVIGRMGRKGISSALTPGGVHSAKPRSRLARQISQATAVPPPPMQESPPMLTPHPPAEQIAPPPPAEPPPPPTAGATTFFCLTEHVCRYPMWGHNETPTEYLFCGQPTDDGPYCPFHFNLTHVAAAPRRRAA